MRGTGSARWSALRVTTRKAPPTFSTSGTPRDVVLAVRKTFTFVRVLGLHLTYRRGRFFCDPGPARRRPPGVCDQPDGGRSLSGTLTVAPSNSDHAHPGRLLQRLRTDRAPRNPGRRPTLVSSTRTFA